MKVLVVGGGGREHALCWKLVQSPALSRLIAAPGNPGIAGLPKTELAAVAAEDVAGLVALARSEGVDLVVVGPEKPLSLGLADALALEGIPCFGPSKAAAEVEASKAFAKGLMERAGIPTAAFGVFEDPDAAKVFAAGMGGKVAVKADGLAAGKGVVVCDSPEESAAAIDEMMVDRAFGAAGARVVIEEKLEGEEASLIALVDGERYVLLDAAQDHKRIFDGDQGPNTGGMGAYSPTPAVDDAILARVREEVIGPAVRQLAKEGRPFRGALYAGLMLTAKGPKVIEFNARLGDPETQPILFRLESDLLEVLLAAAKGDLSGIELRFSPEIALTVVMAAAGYPGTVRTGDPISGLEEAGEGAFVFHAGTTAKGGEIVTAGGRVLGVTAKAPSVAEARARVYEACSKIDFAGAQFRRDIGKRALGR
ncbi:phosphoribosylamine--glycine ligase [Vulgatibacter incomptus]|uniref:Phosphoribosylamine--glycine ligase n=1 Tax=Vulgatibacter incomptus TaxID=1391653 RepID=A0A0K1PC64_9BACT|nr:phosphoribosylamine--glycine ligase [Vulgatibacter incomptus]AKU91110.1 Phosphoribosylamine--glycine ligase [Vulgatibacter incomptus]